jgi:hypothetical protein
MMMRTVINGEWNLPLYSFFFFRLLLLLLRLSIFFFLLIIMIITSFLTQLFFSFSFLFLFFALSFCPVGRPTTERREHVRLRDAVKERLQIAVQMLFAALGLFPARPDVGPAADDDGQRRRQQHRQSQQPQQHR